jgi:hypothetical protein
MITNKTDIGINTEDDYIFTLYLRNKKFFGDDSLTNEVRLNFNISGKPVPKPELVPVKNDAPFIDDFKEDIHDIIHDNRNWYADSETSTDRRFYTYTFPTIKDPEEDEVKMTFSNQDSFNQTFMTIEKNE